MIFNKEIYIQASGIICALGHNDSEIWEAYLSDSHFLSQISLENGSFWVGNLPQITLDEVSAIQQTEKYKAVDPTVLYALFASRLAVKNAGWSHEGADFGINIGSSRGATQRWEEHFDSFSQSAEAQTLSSPLTTLGNIASWVATDLGSQGPSISHSITCSTSLHALLNGVAWLQAGMCDQFLVGGVEAALTPFTLAQMKALKIYAPSSHAQYPCRALDFQKSQNTMVLGEGAAVFALDTQYTSSALAKIIGVGFANEVITHPVSISTDALCFQQSMSMALKNAGLTTVDAVVMHAPGTKLGDQAEFNALKKLNLDRVLFTSNKWKVGHTFGASGALSLDLGIKMLQHQYFIGVPFANMPSGAKKLNHIMVNAVGFGGNAVSVILERV